MNLEMPIISNSSNSWATGQRGFQDPLGVRAQFTTSRNIAERQGVPTVAPPSVANAWIQNNQEFANQFSSSGDMFSNPYDNSIWEGQSTWNPDTHVDSFPISQSSSRQSEYLPNLRNDWDRIENRVNQNASDMLSGNRSAPQTRSGLGYDHSFDNNQIQTRGGEDGGASEIAKAAQQAGQAGVNIYTAVKNSKVDKNYYQNMARSGIHSDLHANIIRSQETNRNSISNAAGQFGAIFGPIGAVAGTAIGNWIQSKSNPNSDQFKTAFSNQGKVNPQDTGIVSGNNTANMSGQSQQTTT